MCVRTHRYKPRTAPTGVGGQSNRPAFPAGVCEAGGNLAGSVGRGYAGGGGARLGRSIASGRSFDSAESAQDDGGGAQDDGWGFGEFAWDDRGGSFGVTGGWGYCL